MKDMLLSYSIGAGLSREKRRFLQFRERKISYYVFSLPIPFAPLDRFSARRDRRQNLTAKRFCDILKRKFLQKDPSALFAAFIRGFLWQRT
jgi:hypothetical protein